MFGGVKPNVLVSVPQNVKNVSADDILKALKPLQGIKPFELSDYMFRGTKMHYFDAVLDIVQNPLDNAIFVAK
jgi:hypothetical protein